MCKTIVITSTEECEAYQRILDREKTSARKNNYASERARPVKWMSCTCCGESYRGRQWWNQDCGYGLGDCCVNLCGADRTPDVETTSYGVSGIHFLIGGES
jgi:hypothetical protein